jgi:hypothetical protein
MRLAEPSGRHRSSDFLAHRSLDWSKRHPWVKAAGPRSHSEQEWVISPTPCNGGPVTLVSTPERIAAEASAAGLRIVEVVDGLYPETVSQYFTPWYHYI